MFTTGFTMAASKLAESMDGDTIHWMRQFSWPIPDSGLRIHDRSMKMENFSTVLCGFTGKQGEVISYDKKHLFSLADENHHFHAGTDHLEIEYKNWRIMPFICYDLRFPVWMHQCQRSWPDDLCSKLSDQKEKAWSTLLPARAIENAICYVAGVNIIGQWRVTK